MSLSLSQGDFTAGHSFSLLLLSCFSLSSPNQTLGFNNRTFFFVIFNFTSVYIFIFVPGRFHNRAFFFFFSILCMSLSSPNQTLSHGNLTIGLFFIRLRNWILNINFVSTSLKRSPEKKCGIFLHLMKQYWGLLLILWMLSAPSNRDRNKEISTYILIWREYWGPDFGLLWK